MGPTPLTTVENFQERVIPELVRRWERHCYCRSRSFLKLISFNFEDYKIAPAALVDSEMIFHGLIATFFEPLTRWLPTSEGSERRFRCPQCRGEFVSKYEQYSINMDRTTTLSVESRAAAPVGLYVVGFHAFAGFDINRIVDFRMAPSVEAFIDHVTDAA